MAEPSKPAMELMDVVQFALDAADDAGYSGSYTVARYVVDALTENQVLVDAFLDDLAKAEVEAHERRHG